MGRCACLSSYVCWAWDLERRGGVCRVHRAFKNLV